MKIVRQYHKLSYTDIAAHKAFKADIDALDILLESFGLMLDRRTMETSYEYLSGYHIMTAKLGGKHFDEKQEKLFGKLVETMMKAVEEK